MINHAHREGRVPQLSHPDLKPKITSCRDSIQSSRENLVNSFLDLSICLFICLFVFNLFFFWDRALLCRVSCPRTHYFYLCMCMFACLCTVCMQYPWRPEESIGPLREVTEGCEPPSPCCEPHLGPLQAQQVLLAVNPSLQLLNRNLIKEENQLRPLINSTTFPKTGR